MSAVILPQHQRNKLPPSSSNVQSLLDENAKLIQTITEYQSKGRAHECLQYQNTLHRNLVYLATIADSSPQPNMQPLLQQPSGSSTVTQGDQVVANRGPQKPETYSDSPVPGATSSIGDLSTNLPVSSIANVSQQQPRYPVPNLQPQQVKSPNYNQMRPPMLSNGVASGQMLPQQQQMMSSNMPQGQQSMQFQQVPGSQASYVSSAPVGYMQAPGSQQAPNTMSNYPTRYPMYRNEMNQSAPMMQQPPGNVHLNGSMQMQQQPGGYSQQPTSYPQQMPPQQQPVMPGQQPYVMTNGPNVAPMQQPNAQTMNYPPSQQFPTQQNQPYSQPQS